MWNFSRIAKKTFKGWKAWSKKNFNPNFLSGKVVWFAYNLLSMMPPDKITNFFKEATFSQTQRIMTNDSVLFLRNMKIEDVKYLIYQFKKID